MTKIFLDANYFIGLVNMIPEANIKMLDGHEGHISTLSCHILYYVNKEKIPNTKLNRLINSFHLTDLDEVLFKNSLEGPTGDLEDNIQLHSASNKDCDYFLTFDKKLLKMKFFGKTKIVSIF